MYNIKEIKEKNIWNDAIIASGFSFYSFLQSWEWGELQKDFGKQVQRYSMTSPPAPLTLKGHQDLKGEGSIKGIKNKYKKDKIIGFFQVLTVRAKRGNYYFIPHGPLIDEKYFSRALGEIVDFLKTQAKKENIDFIRFNSTAQNTKQNKKVFERLGFRNAPMHEHAEDTHLLNLSKTETELLGNIKKKDRYYINRAIKEGVQVRIDNKKDHIEKLIEMHHNHAQKVGYHKFSKDFIENLYKHFGDNISTLSTSYENNIESILMTIRFGDMCVYYIAASDIIHSKFSPNYLCQWEAIKKAKKDGCTLYNFWGVSPDENPKHPIAGVTQFKRKFGGYDYSLLHAQDLPLSLKYYINWIIETCRRIKRGYYYKKPF